MRHLTIIDEAVFAVKFFKRTSDSPKPTFEKIETHQVLDILKGEDRDKLTMTCIMKGMRAVVNKPERIQEFVEGLQTHLKGTIIDSDNNNLQKNLVSVHVSGVGYFMTRIVQEKFQGNTFTAVHNTWRPSSIDFYFDFIDPNEADRQTQESGEADPQPTEDEKKPAVKKAAAKKS